MKVNTSNKTIQNVLLGINTALSASKELFVRLTNKIRHVFNRVFHTTVSSHSELLASQQPIRTYHMEWARNLAILKDIEQRTDNPDVAKRLQFLSTNYLAKAAPSYVDYLQWMNENFESLSQTTPYHPFSYHRYGGIENLSIGDSTNKQLALPTTSPFIPTDTNEFQDLLHLRFRVIDTGNQEVIYRTLMDALETHIASFPSVGIAFRQFFSMPIVIDLTQSLPDIRTAGDKEKNKAFEEAMESYHQAMQKTLKRISVELETKYPQVESRTIRMFLKYNTTHIYRVPPQDGGLAGIKVLPTYRSLKGEKARTVHHHLLNFMAITGLYAGSISLRKNGIYPENPYGDITYAVGKKEETLVPLTLFETPTDFLSLRAYEQFQELATQAYSPDIRVMAGGTAAIVEGILTNIPEERWSQLDASSIETVQFALYHLKESLASARLWCNIDHAKFLQSIELAHCDITTLLEFLRPFADVDFEPLFLKNLSHIPEELESLTQAGLGKTGVNVFTAVNYAVSKQTPQFTRAYGKGLYFEEVAFTGHHNKLESILQDPSIEQVDFFACQFHSNIDVLPTLTHYESAPIADDIRRILKEKPKTQHMTVAVDCTIDYIRSQKVHDLLETFKEEIKKGTLNFVFFRSGQKFDMLGMDNYYGSPFYVVNNGQEPWNSFVGTMKGAPFQTDSLSHQWFTAANSYAVEYLEGYRRQIFSETRRVLDAIPDQLKSIPEGPKQPNIRVNQVSDDMECCFLDIKITGFLHKIRAKILFAKFHVACVKERIKTFSRSSIGFYHPNTTVLAINEIQGCTTIRLCPGINSKENDAIIKFLNSLS